MAKQHRTSLAKENPKMSQDDIRRFRKQQQKANRPVPADEGGLAAKHLQEIEIARSRAKKRYTVHSPRKVSAKPRLTARDFRIKQAMIASDHSHFTSLADDSDVKKLVGLIILEFIDIKPLDGESRTTAAIKVAKLKTGHSVETTHKLAESIARRILKQAYEQMKAPETQSFKAA